MLAMSMIERYAMLLISVPLVVAASYALLIGTIVAINWLRRWARQRAGRLEAFREKYLPDGLPYPPSGRGMCDSCGKPSEKVYYVPSGVRPNETSTTVRLCESCYRAQETDGQDHPAPEHGPAGGDRQ